MKTKVCNSHGSGYCEIADSEVLAVVYGPFAEPRERGHSTVCKLNVKVELSILNCESAKNAEFLNKYKQIAFNTLSHSINLSKYPKTSINLNVLIMREGSCTISSIINSSMLALLDAGVSLNDQIASFDFSRAENSQLALFQQTNVNKSNQSSANISLAINSGKICNFLTSNEFSDDEIVKMFNTAKKLSKKMCDMYQKVVA